MKYDNNKSFFYQTALLLSKYNLSDILGKNTAIPSKVSCKKWVKTEISTFWTPNLKDEAHPLSSLKFLSLNFGNAETTNTVSMRLSRSKFNRNQKSQNWSKDAHRDIHGAGRQTLVQPIYNWPYLLDVPQGNREYLTCPKNMSCSW